MNSERLESEESLRSLGAEEADDEEEDDDESFGESHGNRRFNSR